VELDVPEPSAGSVRIKVQACGICHSDEYAKEGSRPGIQYPRIPGHEVAGIIDAVGAGVAGWEVGQRVGVGWHGGPLRHCNSCRRGDFVTCSKARQITGLTRDGGYAEFMIASAGALALIPSELSAVEAGPLLCAGVTTSTHCAIVALDREISWHTRSGRPRPTWPFQFSGKMGFDTVAIARGKDKEPLAKELGAKYYIDSESQNAAAEMEGLGGAKVILSTVTSGKAVNAVMAVWESTEN